MIRAAELTGTQLDLWVARAAPACTDLTFEERDDHIVGLADIDGEKVVCVFLHSGNALKTMRLRRKYQMDSAVHYSPSTDWAQGGSIIGAECIALDPLTRSGRVSSEWQAQVWTPYAVMRGSTPLVAAMRAYVASKFGEEFDEGAATSQKGQDK